MCGINGFNFKDRDLIVKMNDIIKYRGPDDSGVYVEDDVSLGNNRLAIIDLSPLGHQPMKLEKDGLVIVFNGEIYNFKDLRAELKGDHEFKTRTDTEVILAAYKKWGMECVKKFNGMFAFAIWDKHAKELFLARDHLGIKPLYYYYDGAKFIFSSEIKGILAHPIKKELNLSALNMYFRLLYVPEPLTPWQKIYKLPPASYLVLKDNKITIKKYWKITNFDDLRDENQIMNLIRDGIRNSIEMQLISDKPLGLYLSGGVDSNALLGVMAQIMKKPVKTFTIGFDIAEQSEKYNADALLARKSADFFKSDHHEIMLTANHVKDNFEKVVWHMDDLVQNHTQPAMFLLSEFAHRNVTVALSGDGGDELFAGYDRYYLNYTLDNVQKIPEKIRENPVVEGFFKLIQKPDYYTKLNLRPGIGRFLAFMAQKENMLHGFLNPSFNDIEATVKFLTKKFFSDSASESLDSTKKFLCLDIQTWLLDDALNRADRMSMAHSLEVRVPFLDYEFVELAMRIPVSFNIKTKDQGKNIFKQAIKDYLPDFIRNQPKRGWFSPMSKWLRGDLREWAREILSESYNRESRQFLNFKEIESIFEKHLSGEHYALNTIWSLVNFQVWLRLFYGNK